MTALLALLVILAVLLKALVSRNNGTMMSRSDIMRPSLVNIGASKCWKDLKIVGASIMLAEKCGLKPSDEIRKLPSNLAHKLLSKIG
ncbi:MAG: hypothetical protein QXR74_04715 [Candidatus Bathyarchaeia archaeon]